MLVLSLRVFGLVFVKLLLLEILYKIAGVASFVIPRQPFATLRGAPFLTFAPGNFGVEY